MVHSIQKGFVHSDIRRGFDRFLNDASFMTHSYHHSYLLHRFQAADSGKGDISPSAATSVVAPAAAPPRGESQFLVVPCLSLINESWTENLTLNPQI